MDNRFRRPGSVKASALGYQFDLDREADEVPTAPPSAVPSANPSSATSLPIVQHRDDFLYLVEHHAVTIVVGETGSGKTTKIPQYLHAAGWCADGYQVVCTQPRRAAAAMTAQRVAEEMNTKIGLQVGFRARFQDILTPGTTQIVFMTDAALLKEVATDPLLAAYSVIVVDEVHERSAASDLLLGLLRKILRQRPALRIIVSSATVNVSKLALFFAGANQHHLPPPPPSGAARQQHDAAPSGTPAVLSVQGRLYPVQEHFLKAATGNYLHAAVDTVLNIHRAEVPGDVLVFLASGGEVQQCMDLMHEALRGTAIRSLSTRLVPLPLHSGVPPAQQAEVFTPTPRSTRRAIFATNLAETSLTIEAVVYVVDALHAKQRAYDPLLDLDSLLIAPITRASAKQRAGRAGRVRPGHCFRLCTQEAFEELREENVPEIQRCHLAPSILQVKSLGIDNIMTFPWLDAPPAEAAVRGLEQLYALGALNENARLTQDVGLKLAELQLDPRLGAALLAAAAQGCSEEVCTIAAIMSVRSIWAASKSKAFHAARLKFAVAEGDMITYLNVWRAWTDHGRSGAWAYRHFISHKALLRAEDIRVRLRAQLKHLGLPLETCDSDPAVVCKALLAGFFLNACQYKTTEYDRLKADDRGTHIYTMLRAAHAPQAGGVTMAARLAVDASSVLAHVRPPWLVFASCQQTSEGLWRMSDVIATDAEALSAAAPHVFERTPQTMC
eukprot:jgi/Ulvmu1/11211/UM072_0048.1